MLQAPILPGWDIFHEPGDALGHITCFFLQTPVPVCSWCVVIITHLSLHKVVVKETTPGLKSGRLVNVEQNSISRLRQLAAAIIASVVPW